ncbi:MAG TPA: amino acid adenylation domain-containing protein [Chitinophaga sp.]|uniref:non-ribosomal peptide synthetase/type I polyketide synthase n=1 Tax=Chitinophaga sp. TaxID=1869181 RepID=UPI002C86A104|nr:non-ribosomal peptide synthetase/type I polyketide synthase [Chitinophaga sp.]HVI46040.1 amino acid adenylation domain-containing protein [Chitinophaga sp.]
MKNHLPPRTLVDILSNNKGVEDKGVHFIIAAGKEEFLSYHQLYNEAVALLGYLQHKGLKRGDELVLQIDNNKTFVLHFWAAILGGIIPVPVSITHYSENARKLYKIRTYLKNPYLVATSTHLEKVSKQDYSDGAEDKTFYDKVLLLDEQRENTPAGILVDVKPDDIAFVQFSSGSTGNPKGVELKHSNLVANIYGALVANGCTSDDRTLSWMPLTHDMGLICFHLYPMAAGIPQALMPTDLFIRHPMLWLQKAGEHRSTITGSPNFGYKYCLDQFSEEKLKGLDLSNLRIIYNGAEPIAASLCRRFMDKFSVYDLHESAMRPAYGLAEATLKVSFTNDLPSLKSLHIQRESLAIGHAIKAVNPGNEEPSGSVLEVVNVGPVMEGMYLEIKDSKGHTLKDGHVGIIWISGPSVASRYYNNDAATKAVTKSDGWLNTGDVGFLLNGYLHIVGRVKDIIIVNGMNIYPHDIEQTVEKLDGIETGKVVACGVPDPETGSEAIAVFILHKSSIEKFLPVTNEVKRFISRELGLEVSHVLPVRKIPKTTSGKVKRHQFVQEYINGVFNDVIAEIDNALKAAERPVTPVQHAGEEKIRIWLQEWLQRDLRISASELAAGRTFAEYGMTSVMAVKLARDLENWLGTTVSKTVIYNFPTIAMLSAYFEGVNTPDHKVHEERGKSNADDNNIAVIGMGCRFPGGVHSAEDFWQLLTEQRSAVAVIPEDRWDVARHFSADEDAPGKMYTRAGGFIEGVDQFDPLFFGISPREAVHIDPQQRLLLEVCWEALEHAGIRPSALRGSESGVFIGTTTDDYQKIVPADTDDTQANGAFSLLGTARSVTAGRIAYVLDFHGPVIQLDTACSSSLLSVHQACQSLLHDECSLALAGGVNIILDPDGTIQLCRMKALSPTGLCKTFDDSADGYVRGEGAGIVVLKRLSDAVAAGDNILGVIKGSAVNHDGLSNGLTAPNGVAQQQVIKKALKNAGIAPETVQYVETHGTGTQLGDPIEVQALNAVYRHTDVQQPLLLGAVKTNIGHLEAAAGIAGLIKAILCLQHKQLPANLHFHTPNRFIPWQDMSVRVVDRPMSWPATDGKRRAAVSSFGLSGTNVHVILEEAEMAAPVATKNISFPSYPLLLSAKTPASLRALVTRYLAQPEHVASVQDLAYSAALTRDHFQYRIAIEVSVADTVHKHLQAYLDNAAPGIELQGMAALQAGKPTWMFTGGGSQYWGMGKELYDHNRLFKSVLDHCSDYLEPRWGFSLITLLYSMDKDEANLLLQQMTYFQPAIFAVSCALAAVWKSWGVYPAVVIGHSLGEYAAAYVAGVFSLDDGLKLVTERARLMQAVKEPGAMATVFASEDVVSAGISPYGRDLAIGVINGPELTVISGKKEAIASALQSFEAKGISSRELLISHASHSPLMESILDEFRKVAEQITYYTPVLPLISNVTGEVISGEMATVDYWCRHIVAPVQFSKGLQQLSAFDPSVLMELGPQPNLLSIAQLTGDYSEDRLLRSMHLGQSSWSTMLQSVMALHLKGTPINWEQFFDHQPYHRVQLPGYSFIRQRYWAGPDNIQSSVTDQHIKKITNTMGITIQAQTDHRADILLSLTTVFGNLLKISPAEINIHTRLVELGADSLVLASVIKRVEKKYDLNFSIKQVFQELNTIDLMTDYIVKHGKLENPLPAMEESQITPAPATPAAVADMIPGRIPAAAADYYQLMQQQLELLSQHGRYQYDLMAQQLRLLSGGVVADDLVNGNGKTIVSPVNTLALKNNAVAASGYQAPVAEKLTIQQNGQSATPKKHQSIFPKMETKPGQTGYTPAQQVYLDDFIRRYTQKTKTSKALAQQYRPVLADNRASAGFRFSTKEILYPIQATASQGAKITDVDGNVYVDLAMGFGVNLLGHCPDVIIEALQQQVQRGFQLGPQTPLAGQVATLIASLTGMERVSFHNSGTEAVMTAIRLARTVTGKTKVAMFTGSYHGHFDGTLAMPEDLETAHNGIPMAPGVAQNMVADVLLFDYHHPDAVQHIQKHIHELAAVLVEPVQSRRPGYQPAALLRALRELTAREGVVLIFDEMITGFRVHPGGAQAHFGIQADLATYGKVVGGGLPIGVIAGKRKYMDALDGGMWQYGDDSFPTSDTTFFAGTFCKHPLSMVSSLALLQELDRRGPSLQEQLNIRTASLVSKISALFAENNVPMQVYHFGSLFYFAINTNMDLFFYHLLEKGVYVWEGRTCFLSDAHTDEDIDFIYRSIRDSVHDLQQGGFLQKPSTDAKKEQPVKLNGSQALSVSSSQTKAALSFSQERMWFIDQLNGSVQYNERMAYRLKGELDKAALQYAFRNIINRHEVLRTVITEVNGEGQPRLLDKDLWQLAVTSYPGLREDKERLQEYLTELVHIPFDLSKDHMLRAHLIPLDTDEHILLLTIHHIALDGWSVNILFHELNELYNAYITQRTPQLAPLPLQYGDYAIWQREYFSGKEAAVQLDYWKTKLTGTAILDLPADYIRPAMQSTRGAKHFFRFDKELTGQIKQLGRAHNATLFMTMLTAFKVLLYRYSGQTDICVGTSIDGRSNEDLEGLVGFFVNTLALRSDLDGAPAFTTLLQQVGQTTLEAFEYAEVPFGKIIEAVEKNRDMSRTPLFQVMFELYNTPEVPKITLGKVQPISEPVGHTTTLFDLSFCLEEDENGLSGYVEYCLDLFSPETIAGMTSHYEQLIRSVIKSPEQSIATMPIMSAMEQQQLLGAFNDTATLYPDQSTFIDRFSEQVTLTPDAMAILFENTSLTYKELDERANQLAHYLRSNGIGADILVPVCIERSLEMIIAILGIMKAGGAYVPIEAEYPAERIAYMLEESNAGIIVSSSRFREKLEGITTIRICEIDGDATLLDIQPVSPLPTSSSPSDLAYVIYTSGSTGKPKGVMVEHGGMLNHLLAKVNDLKIDASCMLAYTASYTFDISVWQMFAPLLRGGATAVYTEEQVLTPRILLQALKNDGITILEVVPSYLEALLQEESAAALKNLQYLLVTGEPVSRSLLVKWFEHKDLGGIPVVNAYGPTEASDDITHHLMYAAPERNNVPLGKPIQNLRIYILDKARQLCPVGVAGEISVSGIGVSRGYLKDPARTAEKFVKDPFQADDIVRMYCTGDLGRWLPDGTIEMLGRIDDQVKIRGFRIELGEIENALQQHPMVRLAVVLARKGPDGNNRLIGYVTENPGYNNDTVIAYLKDRLPGYMVPDVLVLLPELPLTPNGKIDRKALPAPGDDVLKTKYVAPETALEQALEEICRRLLESGRIGVNDNLFELGMHSLMVMRLGATVREQFGLHISVRTFFKLTTIGALAAYIRINQPEVMVATEEEQEIRL